MLRVWWQYAIRGFVTMYSVMLSGAVVSSPDSRLEVLNFFSVAILCDTLHN